MASRWHLGQLTPEYTSPEKSCLIAQGESDEWGRFEPAPDEAAVKNSHASRTNGRPIRQCRQLKSKKAYVSELVNDDGIVQGSGVACSKPTPIGAASPSDGTSIKRCVYGVAGVHSWNSC